MSRAGAGRVRRQVVLPWGASARISLLGLRARFSRSLITTISLALAVALLAFTLAAADALAWLRASGDESVRQALGRAGLDAAADARQRWIVGLSLLVCVVGVANAQFMAVTERFRDIGTMKCLGALDSFILRLLLLEAALQGLVGSAVGVLAGTGAALVDTAVRFGRAALGGWLGSAGTGLATAMGTALAVGLGLALAGVLPPALAAARLGPVQAMRAE